MSILAWLRGYDGHAARRLRAAWAEQQRAYWTKVKTGAGLTRATREYLETL